jgi:molybdopterin-guanine dinucleotide biosynthesis protein A
MNAYILAGGKSTRMGQEKALFTIQETPMSVIISEKLKKAGCDNVFLISKNKLPMPILQISEKYKEQHPLYGVHTALNHCMDSLCLITPCDLPFVSVDSYRLLMEQKQETVASEKNKIHPLLGIFSSSRSEEALIYAQKHRSVMSFVQEHYNLVLPSIELRNINRPQDIEDLS